MADIRYADTVVLGGGTAGAAVAGRLAQNSDRSILLLEAGPDYGALDRNRWPPDWLNARSLPVSHDWGYTNASSTGRPSHPLERARVSDWGTDCGVACRLDGAPHAH